MPAAKIAITIDPKLLRDVDLWVAEGKYPNRSKAIQSAVKEMHDRWRKTRLADACAMADPDEEQAMADETFLGDIW